MKPDYQLLSFHIIEKLNNNNKLITWSYPCISDNVRGILIEKALNENDTNEYIYYRTKNNEWVHIWERYTERKVYALALVSKTYQSNKYYQFGISLCGKYEKNYNPVHLVELYMTAFTTGTYLQQENGTQIKIHLNNNNSRVYIKDLINLFKLEIILIYNALLLKKRVLVYHSNLSLLFKYLQSITLLIDAKYRDPNEYFYPIIKNVNVELKGKTFFVAGIRDKVINIKQTNYDLFINLQTQDIKIASHAKEIFGMTKLHKEVAKLMVQCVEDENCDDLTLIRKLNEKTDDILINLKSLATRKDQNGDNKVMLTLEELRERKLNPIMENFLFNLAVAESMMIL